MKAIKIYTLIIFVFATSFASSQCDVKNKAFKAGEEIVYDAVYNWGLIWVEAGKVTFSVTNDVYDGKEVYNLSGVGTSLPKYDWFFKLRDYYNSYINKDNIYPYKYVRNTSERNYKVDNTFLFDYKKKKIYTESKNSDKELEKDTFQLQSCTFDLMSAIYYVRNINFDNYKIDEKIPLKLIVDNEMVELYVRKLGKEVLKTKQGEIYPCIKISAVLMKGTIFKGGEDVTVWISDDKNRIPVLVEAEILVGTVKAVLASTKGLRTPLNKIQEK